MQVLLGFRAYFSWLLDFLSLDLLVWHLEERLNGGQTVQLSFKHTLKLILKYCLNLSGENVKNTLVPIFALSRKDEFIQK